MLDLKRDGDSLTNAKRNPAEFLRQLKKEGSPIILTINGQAKLVVQDAKSYEKLLELVDRLETIEAIRVGMAEIEEGKGLSLEEAKERARP